jgi:hypothetical protein
LSSFDLIEHNVLIVFL